jgi:hypothetical protein
LEAREIPSRIALGGPPLCSLQVAGLKSVDAQRAIGRFDFASADKFHDDGSDAGNDGAAAETPLAIFADEV